MEEESWGQWWIDDDGYCSYGYSVFAKALLDGLGCGWPDGTHSGGTPCDSNGVGIASLSECANYVYYRANEIIQGMNGTQTQHCMSYGPADYPLFRMK